MCLRMTLGPREPMQGKLWAAGSHTRAACWHACATDPLGAWRPAVKDFSKVSPALWSILNILQVLNGTAS